MILIIMGVSGSGKTTIGKKLAEQTGWKFYEGDDFHSRANIEKMQNGIPLKDEGRRPWLAALHQLILNLEKQQRPAILASSALKADYRSELKNGKKDVRFVYLKGDYSLFKKRLEKRSGHFFDPELLKSQCRALEEPGDTLAVEAALPPDRIAERITAQLKLPGQKIRN